MMTTARALDVGTFVMERVTEPPRRRRAREELDRIARVAYTEAGGACPGEGTWMWTPHRATWVAADAVVKLARVEYGEVSMRDEDAIRSRIHAWVETQGWCDRVARTLWSGTQDGSFVVVETRLPGESLEGAMRDDEVLAPVSEQLAEFRRTTRHQVIADDTRLMTWFRGPALTVSALLQRWGHRRLADAVHAWAARTADRLAGHEVGACLVHGDLWPGNVLVQDGRISGVVDWDKASVHDAALHDTVHFTLYPAARAGRTDLGQLVREALDEDDKRGDLRRALARRGFEEHCDDFGIGPEDALVWYWLRHTARMSPEPGHANNPRWVGRNIVSVATALTEGNRT